MSINTDPEKISLDDLVNARTVSRGDPGVLRIVAAVAVHGPDEPARRADAQASSVGARTGRSDARARRLRSARRALLAVRPHVPDRDAGRSEHRPHHVARLLRAGERPRLRRDAVPRREERQGDGRDRVARREPAKRTRSSRRRTRKLNPDGTFVDELVLCRQRGDVPLAAAGPHRLHGRGAGAARLDRRGADSVPRARRRQPRADGLEHAAPGRAAAQPAARRSSARVSRRRWPATRAPSSSRSAPASSRA